MGPTNTFRMCLALTMGFYSVGTLREYLKCLPDASGGRIKDKWHGNIVDVRHMFPAWAHCDRNAGNIHNVPSGSMLVTIWVFCGRFYNVSPPGSAAHIK